MPSKPPTPSPRSRAATASIAAVLGAVLAWPSPATAAGAPEVPATETPASSAETPSSPDQAAPADPAASTKPPTVEAALEAGDLATAKELATAARLEDPSAANWHREAEVLERMGDYAGATAAYQGELEAAPVGKRKAVRQDLARVQQAARGTVAGEPASTHRKELDRRWSSKRGAKKTKATQAPDAPADAKDDRIVRKWYFWVTVAAIVASAAAVTGIAVKAARDERGDALDLQRGPTLTGPPLLRF
jgi:hypothetical protein